MRPTGERIAAARPNTAVERLLCGLDHAGRRHLLVLLRDGEDEFRDRESRGLNVDTRELGLVGEGTSRYLDIQCIDAAGYAALDVMAAEIGEGLLLAGTDTPPHDVVRRVLAKWRRFWGHLPKSLLTRDEQVGLFAELWFLCYWLLPNVGVQTAVNRWTGPFGARHDFEWPQRSVEAKGTASTRGRVHIINGLDQLEAPENGELYLFSLRVREELSATNSLPSVIDAARRLLAAEAEAVDHLDSALARWGYAPTHEEDYRKVRLRIVDERLYAVGGDFPRLTRRSLRVNPPEQVERVQYELNLSGVEEFCIARSAGDSLLKWWA
jgi:hypothetical protein